MHNQRSPFLSKKGNISPCVDSLFLSEPESRSALADCSSSPIVMYRIPPPNFAIPKPYSRALFVRKLNEWPLRDMSGLKDSAVEELREYYPVQTIQKETVALQGQRRKLLEEGQMHSRRCVASKRPPIATSPGSSSRFDSLTYPFESSPEHITDGS